MCVFAYIQELKPNVSTLYCSIHQLSTGMDDRVSTVISGNVFIARLISSAYNFYTGI